MVRIISPDRWPNEMLPRVKLQILLDLDIVENILDNISM